MQDQTLHFIELSVQSSGKTFLCVLCCSKIDVCTPPHDWHVFHQQCRATSTYLSFWRKDLTHFECQFFKYSLAAWFLLPSFQRTKTNSLKEIFLKHFMIAFILSFKYYHGTRSKNYKVNLIDAKCSFNISVVIVLTVPQNTWCWGSLTSNLSCGCR